MFSFFLYMFFSLHWWSRSTISLADIRCSVAASLSCRRCCWRSRATPCIIFFVFLTLFGFLHCSVLFHFLRGFLWVFWFAPLLLPCLPPLPLSLSLLTLLCHSSSTLPSHKIGGVLNFLEFFYNVLAYTSAVIRNSRTYKWYLQVRLYSSTYKWYLQVRLYSSTLISSIYKCVLIKCGYICGYIADLINLK